MSGASAQQAQLYHAAVSDRTQDYLKSLQRKGQEKLERLLEEHTDGLGAALSNEITKALTGKNNVEILGELNKKAFEKAGQLAKKGFKSGKKALEHIQSRINGRRAEAGQDEAGINPDGSVNMRPDTYGRNTADLVRRRGEQARDGLGYRPETDHYTRTMEMKEVGQTEPANEEDAAGTQQEDVGGMQETGMGQEQSQVEEGVSNTSNEEEEQGENAVPAGESMDEAADETVNEPSVGARVGTGELAHTSINTDTSDMEDVTGGTLSESVGGDILPTTSVSAGTSTGLGAGAAEEEAGSLLI